jgi:hypothetical protein
MESRQGWERWAPFLERTRPRADAWLDGLIDRSPLIYLFADGVHSASHTHWIYRVEDNLRSARLRGVARGFSYAGQGLPYETEHTRQNVRQAVRRYRAYLAALRADQRLVALGFSLGTVVTLLGVADWLRTSPSDPAATVPAVVLIAPAHATAPELLLSYERWAAQDETATSGERRRVPYVARQLASISSRVRADAHRSYRSILESGIQVHVIHWPHDALTPYRLPDSTIEHHPGFHVHPVMARIPLSSIDRAISAHMDVRDHPRPPATSFASFEVYNQDLSALDRAAHQTRAVAAVTSG